MRGILYLIILVIYSSWGFATSIDHIQLTNKARNDTEILLTLDSKFRYSAFTLNRPDRVVVDIDQATLNFPLKSIDLKNSVVKGIRSSNSTKRLRIVFDLTHNQKMETVRLKPQGKSYRLAIKLSDKSHTVKAVTPKKLRPVVVVIDPGHGGKDPGAIGKRGIQEKNITLRIAKKLKYYINKQPGMKAVLTRRGDYYVGLRQRLAIARKQDADIFISIHADAFKNRQSNGASVFALSQKGATSEAARWIAEKENYSELGGVNLSELDDKSGLVRSVLIDLSQTATIGASLHLGERILSHVDTITNLHHEKVEQARFVVLKSPDIPSVLIETGFISNRQEEKNLSSPSYQRRMALAIFKGLNRYFWDYPPAGSYLYAKAKTKSYRVTKGDTLSKIAQQYNTTVKTLMAKNKLRSPALKIGQVISIPISRS